MDASKYSVPNHSPKNLKVKPHFIRFTPPFIPLSNPSYNIIYIDSTIRANYGNFGYFPFGQSLMGHLHYNATDSQVCDEVEEIDRREDISPFFLAKRGSCSFVQKVRNMENSGAAVAIIVDNRYEMTDDIIMSDDGTGGGIRIPSMLIGEYDGD